jgi:hypothetical protein
MTEDLRRDLRELPPPSLDVPGDFYERVIASAGRRRRAMWAGSTGVAAAVVAAVVAVSVSLASTSSTARLIPVTPPPSPSAVTPTPAPTTSPSASTPASQAPASPSARPVSAAPPVVTSTSTPAVVVDYPPRSYANLPSPATCPSGYNGYGNPGTGSEMCIPPGYGPLDVNDCPAGSHWSMGPVVCSSDAQPAAIVAPVSHAGLPSLPFASLPTPSCQNGYLAAGTFTTVTGLLHCAPAAYLPRAGYTCPAGSELATDPAPLCFTSGPKDTIVAPVPTS